MRGRREPEEMREDLGNQQEDEQSARQSGLRIALDAAHIIGQGSPVAHRLNCDTVAVKAGLADMGGRLADFEGNYFEQGLRLLEAGDFAGAIGLFDSAIKLGLGDIAEIHVCRATALAALGRREAAVESVNAALEIEPYLAGAYFERGAIRCEQGEFEMAISDFTMAIHIEPEFEDAYYSRALAYEERKRYAAAEADLTRALALNPQLLAAYEARGRARAAQFKFDEAVADFSHYLRSGGGKRYDNHSETQGYLLILRVMRLVWRLVPRRGRRDGK